MNKYMVKANWIGRSKYTTRTVNAENPDRAIEIVLAEKDARGKNAFDNVMEVWERVRWTETKREMKSNG